MANKVSCDIITSMYVYAWVQLHVLSKLVHNIDAMQHKFDARIEFRSILVAKI